MSSRRAVTSAHARDEKWRPSLAPFSRRCSLGFPSPENQANIELYTTSLTHIPLPLLYLLLMLRSMQIRSHARGVLLPRYAIPSIISLLGLKLPSVMSLRPIAPSPSSQTSGQAWSSSWSVRISSPSTSATILALRQPGAFMARSAMPPWTFFGLRRLAPSPDGSTITSSFASPSGTVPHIMSVVNAGMPPSCRRVIAIKPAVVFGIRGRVCLTACLQSLTKMLPTPSEISLISLVAPPLTRFSHIVTQTSMAFPDSLAFLGNRPRLSPSRTWSLTLVSNGTYLNAPWLSPSERRPSTGLPSKIGCLAQPIIWTMSNSSTVSSFTRVWCSLQDVLTSPVWKASWLLSAPTLSSRTTPLATPPPICLGGSMSSDPQRSLVPSQAQPSSQTETAFQTPAQVLVSALLLATNGEHGVSSQGGRQMVGTSGGQRPSASSSSLDLSVQRAYQVSFSKSLVTTAASSRAGGREGAETGKPTGSSGASMTSRLLTDALLSHATLPVVKTQQMAPPEDSTLRLLVSSQHAVSPTLSGNLSSILTTNPSPPDMGLDWAGLSIAASPIVASPTHRVSHSTNPC